MLLAQGGQSSCSSCVWSGEQMYHPGERLSVNSHRHRKASPQTVLHPVPRVPQEEYLQPKPQGPGRARDPCAQGIQVIQPGLLIKPRTEVLVWVKGN